MTKETMTKEQILTKHGILNRELFIKDVSTIHLQIGKEKYNSCLNAMSEWESQELSAERERAGKLVEAVNHVLESWNERMGVEREQLVVSSITNTAYWSPIASQVDSKAINNLREKLNEYDTATKS